MDDPRLVIGPASYHIGDESRAPTSHMQNTQLNLSSQQITHYLHGEKGQIRLNSGAFTSATAIEGISRHDLMTMCGYDTCSRACNQGSARCPIFRVSGLPKGESFVDSVKHGFHSLCGVKSNSDGLEKTDCNGPIVCGQGRHHPS